MTHPSRLLTAVAISLVALLGAEPSAAMADPLGGVVVRATTFLVDGPANPPTILLADNFTTASALSGRLPENIPVGGPAWVEVRGKWTVRNGYLDPPQMPGALVLYPAGATDATVETAVTIAGPYHFGPVLRANAAGTSYLVVHMASTNTLTVDIVVAGTSTTLLSRDSTQGWVSPTGTFTFGATLRGTTLDLRVNNSVVLAQPFSTTDLNPLNGFTSVGVWVSSSGNEMLDDVRATTPV